MPIQPPIVARSGCNPVTIWLAEPKNRRGLPLGDGGASLRIGRRRYDSDRRGGEECLVCATPRFGRHVNAVPYPPEVRLSAGRLRRELEERIGHRDSHNERTDKRDSVIPVPITLKRDRHQTLTHRPGAGAYLLG
jgi:hypothetical protein